MVYLYTDTLANIGRLGGRAMDRKIYTQVYLIENLECMLMPVAVRLARHITKIIDSI